MVVSAEKARAKAEARRARILAKSAERLDVVSGLVSPDGSKAEKSDVAADNGDNGHVVADVNGVNDGVGDGVDGVGADKANDNENNNVEAAAENDNIPSSNKGARRMAAMLRERSILR